MTTCQISLSAAMVTESGPVIEPKSRVGPVSDPLSWRISNK